MLKATTDTNCMRLHVFANDQTAQAVLIAVYDNLGKGAFRRGGTEPQSDAGASPRTTSLAA